MKNVLMIVPPPLTFDSFVNPPEHNSSVITDKDGRRYGRMITEFPLGCLALSSYIKSKCDVNVALVDFSTICHKVERFTYNSFYEFFYNYLQNYTAMSPDIICISSLFSTVYQSTLDIAKCCKEIFPNAVVIVGGSIGTHAYMELIEDSNDTIDGMCYGEGELPLLDLLQNGNFNHTSWVTKEKILNGFIPSNSFIENLDEIPLYDYDLLDVKDYIYPVMHAYSGIKKTYNYTHYMSTRGCPHKCTFCASHRIHGRKMRLHSLDRVIQDLEYFKQNGIESVVFQDDHILSDKSRIMTILQHMQKLELFPIFQNGLALYALDKDILQILKDMGTEQLMLAVESGSARVLKEIMHKPLNHKIIRRVVSDCKDLGLYTSTNIIIGLPGETPKDIEDAIEFLKTVPINWYIMLNFAPLIGSELFDICIEKKYIPNTKESKMMSDFRHPIVDTEEFTPEYIKNKSYEINLYLNFIHNSDFLVGDYKTALKGFLNVIRAKSTHALAHYYIYKCYDNLGEQDIANKHLKECKHILKDDIFWQDVFKKYNITI